MSIVLSYADALAATIKLASSASVLSVVSLLPWARPRSPTRTAPLACRQVTEAPAAPSVNQGNPASGLRECSAPTLAPVRARAGTAPAGSPARRCRTPSHDWPRRWASHNKSWEPAATRGSGALALRAPRPPDKFGWPDGHLSPKALLTITVGHPVPVTHRPCPCGLRLFSRFFFFFFCAVFSFSYVLLMEILRIEPSFSQPRKVVILSTPGQSSCLRTTSERISVTTR